MIQAIVFLPLLAALIAGLGQRVIGTTASKILTTGALFTSCALSWPIFLSFVMGTGEAEVVTVLHWVSSGALQFNWELRVDTGPGYRVYYAQSGPHAVLLLCGGDKHTQDADIDRAVNYWQDWQLRGDDEKQTP